MPRDYVNQVRDLVQKAYAAQMENGEVIVEGRIYPEEMLLRIGFLEHGRLRQANFEASIEYNPESGRAMDALSICVDALGTMMDVYFANQSEESESVQFPIHWKAFNITSGNVFLRFSTVNTKLEAMADELLGQHGEADVDHPSRLN